MKRRETYRPSPSDYAYRLGWIAVGVMFIISAIGATQV